MKAITPHMNMGREKHVWKIEISPRFFCWWCFHCLVNWKPGKLMMITNLWFMMCVYTIETSDVWHIMNQQKINLLSKKALCQFEHNFTLNLMDNKVIFNDFVTIVLMTLNLTLIALNFYYLNFQKHFKVFSLKKYFFNHPGLELEWQCLKNIFTAFNNVSSQNFYGF